MKKGTRLVALLLAVLMLVPFASACSDKTTTSGDTDEIKPLEGETPVDLGGYEFTVVDHDSGRWNREKSGTPYSDAWIQILDEVETLYNCKISATYVAKLDQFTTIQPELVAGGKYADLIITAQYACGQFIGADLFADLNQLNVDWSNEWWNKDLREISTYGDASYFAGASFIFDTSSTWMLYYNESIWKECGFEDPYKLVDDHRWTMDKFTEYCRAAALDMDNSGAMDSIEDRWGVLTADGDFADALYFALGGKYFRTDANGNVQLACNNSRTYGIVEKMYNMAQKDRTVLGKHIASYSDTTIAEKISAFMNGHALFLAYIPGVGQLRDMEDDWGVMPFPLYDESQEEYRSGVDHNSAVFGISKNNTDLDKVSVILEALGRHAMILEEIYWPDYKETYWRHEEEDTRMMNEYVVGHGAHDLALVMQKCANIFVAPRTQVYKSMFGGAGPDYASYMDQVGEAITAGLEEYFAKPTEET